MQARQLLAGRIRILTKPVDCKLHGSGGIVGGAKWMKAGPVKQAMRKANPSKSWPEGEEESLHSAGLKVTLPRLKVLEIFRSSTTRHLSADDVFRMLRDQGQDASLGTVYRVLSQLEQVGLILRSAFSEDRAVYELNEGPHHDHLVCINCGRVEEFTDNTIEARQVAVAHQHGYVLTEHRLALLGLCPKCGASKAKGRRAA